MTSAADWPSFQSSSALGVLNEPRFFLLCSCFFTFKLALTGSLMGYCHLLALSSVKYSSSPAITSCSRTMVLVARMSSLVVRTIRARRGQHKPQHPDTALMRPIFCHSPALFPFFRGVAAIGNAGV